MTTRFKMATVEWAPIKLPIKRRVQTFTVMMQVSIFLFGHMIGCAMLFFLLVFPYTTIFALLYLGWAYILNWQTPSRGGRMITSFRRSKWWKYFCEFFPLTLVKTVDLDPNKNYIFGYHPHGIMGLAAIGNFGTEATGFSAKFPGIVPHLLTLRMNFKFPFIRDLIMASGICSVDKESIEHILQKMGSGHSVVIVVGGAAESLDAHPDSLKLTLKDRKGFVKMALKCGASLVPVFSFGENNLYEQVDNPRGSPLRKWQTKMKDVMGFAPPIFHGRGVLQYTFGLIPYRRPVNTVGEPIHVTRVNEPSVEQVNDFHQKYIEGLISVFEKNKSKYGIPEDKHLEIC